MTALRTIGSGLGAGAGVGVGVGLGVGVGAGAEQAVKTAAVAIIKIRHVLNKIVKSFLFFN